MSIAPARAASTVVLIRPAANGIEVFLVRRHDDIAFMGGAHVFPGGRVDPGDYLDDPDSCCDGVRNAVLRMPSRPPEDAVAFHVGAVRELFEEAGVLLARDPDGVVAAIHGGARVQFDAYRRAIAAGTLRLRAVVEQQRLRIALDALVLFAHWVTPEVETSRFDTQFFLAIAPDAQEAAHDEGETTDGIWIDPAAATERALRGEIALPPPTWTTLRSLARCSTLDDALKWAQSQAAPRIQPRVEQREDGTREILLPGDARYPAIAGFTATETRFILKEGRWIPM